MRDGSAAARAGELKIAAWNIEHLAAADGEGCKPRTDADYAVLAAYAEALDADVIALQEVQSEAAARRVFPANEYDIVMNGQPYPPDQGTCGQNAAQSACPSAPASRSGGAWATRSTQASRRSTPATSPDSPCAGART